MTRLFTALLLLLSTTYLSAQKPLFKGASLKSNFENSAELQYQFQEFDVYQIDVESFDKFVKGAGESMQFSLQLGNDYNWDISMQPRDMRSPGHARRWATENGIVSIPPAKNLTFRGQLGSPGGGSVSLTVDEDLIRGFVKKDGEMYFIEPVWYFMKGQPKDLIVVYPACMVQPRPDATCGYTEMLDKSKQYLPADEHDHENEIGEEKSVACKEVEIAIASDWLMHVHFGSAAAVEAFETGTLADVQTNYDDEFNDQLLFTIVEFFTVSTAGGDPWTSSTNAGTLLSDFTGWGPSGFSQPHDVGGLWTDRNFNGGTIGIAWLSSVCTSQRYHCLQNFSSNACLLRVLWAHEMGHNFSASHDGSGSPTIMAPAVSCTSAWSNQSLNQINAFVPTRTCLAACGGASPPQALFTANPTQGCTPLVVQFTDQSLFNPTSWDWTFSGGTPATSTQQNPVITYSIPGVYDVTLMVSNAAGSNTVTMSAFITVEDVPTPLFTFEQIGLAVVFTNLSSNATSYLWDFGDGNTSTETNPVHTYSVDDFYDVVLTAFNSCGGESFFLTVPVFTPPVASFTADPTSGCATLDVDFMSTSSSNTTAWLWQFPGGTPATSTLENPTVSYAAPGQYDVSLTVANPAGDHTFTINDYITVGTVAVPDFSFTINGLTTTFTNESDNSMGIGNMTFLWNFGDGNTSTLTNPVHTYSTSGTYDVILKVTNSCGTVAITKQVTILLPPVANFSAPTTIGCAPFTVNFMNESTGAASFQWTFPGGDPTSSTVENPTVIYNTPGTYDVTLIVGNSAGSDTITLVDYITVNTTATPGFASAVNGLTVSFTNTSSNATSYSWDFGDGNSSTETDPTHTYANDGDYTVVLTAINDCGSVTTTQIVTIVTAPVAAFSANNTSGCAPLTVQFTNESSANAVNFDWSFSGGNPSSSTDENPTVVYDNPGTYTVILIVSNSAGSDTITQTGYIVVNTVPTAGFTSNANANIVTFTNTSTNATSYSWDFGDGNNSTETNPVHTYADDGDYTVTLTATNGCGSVTTTMTVTIITAPTAAFSANDTSGCAELTVQFTNQSSANAVSYEWTFPGGNPSSSTDENPTVVYSSAGTYSVTLVATNSAGSSTVTVTDFVVVTTVPATSFTVATNVYVATFTNTTVNGTSYSWDFGDGNSSTETNPVHDYGGDGTYEVILTATNDCGTSTTMQTVVITSLPQAGFSADETTGCGPFTVQFMDQSSSNTTSWEWDFPGGNPTSSTDQNPTVTYDNVGTYTITLTASNSLGGNTVTQTNYINVITIPTAGFSSSSNGLTVDFTNNSTGATSYSWDFGDGNNSTEADPSHIYAADGTYEVSLTATNECGSVTSTQTVVVITAPTAAFTADTTAGCVPFVVEFTSQASANTTSWEWDFPGGNPSSSTDENPTVTYSTPGVYSVTLTVSNSAGQDEVVEMDYIVVGGLPTASFNISITGFTVDFINNSTTPANSGNMTYNWDFGDGTTSTEENPQHTYMTDGTYDVALTVTNDCGPKTINGQITVVSAPTAGFIAEETIGCAPFVVQFSNNSSANATSFSWGFPGGTPATSTVENPVITYNAAGVYDVTLTVSNSAGSDMVTEVGYITVNEAPTTEFDVAVLGLNANFTNKSTNFTTVEWDFGDGSTSSENDPSHEYAEDGAYTVTLTTTNECGSTTVTQLVIIATTGPVAAFTASPQAGCAPLEVVFENLSSANSESFMWTFEGGMPPTSTDENPTVAYAVAGSYTVTLIATNALGSDTFTIANYIVVDAAPVPGFTSDVNFLTVSFTNNSINGTTYKWDFGDGESSNETDPVYTYAAPGEYIVTLTATNECGSETTTQTIVVMANVVGEIPGISEFNVFPNPNNGRFTMILRGESRGNLQVSFTNVLGQVLLLSDVDFRSGNVTKEFSFDGLAAGVYIFQVKSGDKALYRKVVVD